MPLRNGAAALALVCAVACGGGERQPGLADALPPRPGLDVVVLTFDAMRADALGLYGNPRATSPHLDAFATRALVFDRAYTPAPVTPTSFASAFSGRLPSAVFHGWQFEAEDTLAGAFSAAGYASAAFLNNVQLTDERGFDRGFGLYRVYPSVSDEEVLDDALRWIEASGGSPIFVWVHLLSPHAPYDWRESAAHLYDPDYSGPFERTTGARFASEDPAEIARIRSLYEGEVFHADSLFGRLVGRLDAAGRLERTLLVVSSDHGEEFGERGGFQHENLYEETVRVPLLIHHPGRPGGARTDALYSHVDLFPTLAAIAVVPAPADLDGENLLVPSGGPRELVAVAMTDASYRGASLRRGSEKLVSHCRPTRSTELYDLADDPGERRDRSAERAPRVRALGERLDALLGGEHCAALDRAVGGRRPTQDLGPERVRQLEALGYSDEPESAP